MYYDGKYEPIEFLSLSSYNQSVNETKPTMSKIKSVDNYLCKWQKLKEWLEKDIEKNHKENEQTDLSVFLHYIAVEQCILRKMQELSKEE